MVGELRLKVTAVAESRYRSIHTRESYNLFKRNRDNYDISFSDRVCITLVLRIT